jgi:hypothetical protein
MNTTGHFVFNGSDVDPWLEGIQFQANITSDNKIVVTPTAETAEAFKQQYDTAMWLEWAHRYAYGRLKRLTSQKKE